MWVAAGLVCSNQPSSVYKKRVDSSGTLQWSALSIGEGCCLLACPTCMSEDRGPFHSCARGRSSLGCSYVARHDKFGPDPIRMPHSPKVKTGFR